MRLKYCLLVVVFFAGVMEVEAQTFEWAKNFIYQYEDEAYSLSSDLQGNIYTTGSYNGIIDIDSGPGTYTLTSLGNTDVFITKHDSDGNLIWAKSVGGDGFDIGLSISCDSVGNVYIVGVYAWSGSGPHDFDPGPALYALNSSFNYSTFILKLDSNGNFVWAKGIIGLYYQYGTCLALDNNGNVYVSGAFCGTVDFDSGAGTSNLTATSNSIRSAFLVKLDSAGNFIWAKQLKGTSHVNTNSMMISESGKIYITGAFEGTCDFNPGTGISNMTAHDPLNPDCFLVKLDLSGNFIWASQFGGAVPSRAEGKSIALDKTEKIYLFGEYDGSTDFDPSPSNQIIINNGVADCFVVKLDSTGAFNWAKTYGGNDVDRIRASCIDSFANIYITGSFRNTVDFNPGVGINNLIAPSNSQDAYILKLDSSGNYIWANHMMNELLFSGMNEEGAGICIGSNSQLNTCGYFMCKTDFDCSPVAQDTFFLTSGVSVSGTTYYKDVYLASYSQNNCSSIHLHVDSTSNVGCNSSGVANISVMNGSPPYNFVWNTIPPSSGTTTFFNGYGLYSVTATDVNMCSTSTSLLINAPTTNSGFDLVSELISTEFRPGFQVDAWLIWYNGGCVSDSGQIKLIKPLYFVFDSANYAPDQVIGDTLIWNFNPITFDSGQFATHIYGSTDVNAPSGNYLCFQTLISPVLGDSDTSNNFKNYCYPVLNGLDPNFKRVYPQGVCPENYVLNNQKLTYSVHFQNTGNSHAVNINIKDTIDSDLDINSVRVITQSHPMITELLPGNTLRFSFDSIMLPDSTSNEVASHGYLIYEIDPLPGKPDGTQIKNHADIYFDFNPPVITNTTLNTLVSVIPSCNNSVYIKPTSQNKHFLLYPNPTKDLLNIENISANSIVKLYDLSGRMVLSQKAGSSKCIINTGNLENGVFIVEVRDEGGKSFEKIIIQK